MRSWLESVVENPGRTGLTYEEIRLIARVALAAIEDGHVHLPGTCEHKTCAALAALAETIKDGR